MILSAHVALALFSIVLATITLFIPSKKKIKGLYVTTVSVILSGILLSLSSPETNMLRACVSGSVFLTFVIAASVIGNRRLSSQKTVNPI